MFLFVPLIAVMLELDDAFPMICVDLPIKYAVPLWSPIIAIIQFLLYVDQIFHFAQFVVLMHDNATQATAVIQQ